MNDMTYTSLVPWFGSKRTLAPAIAAELGPHRTYWEVFCGSMAVLFGKPACSMETVNDLNGDLVNLARTVRDPIHGPAFYRRLRRTWLSSDLFVESAEVIRRTPFEPTPDRAFHYFVFSWMGRNGDAGTTKVGYGFCKRFTSNGGHAAKRFANAVDSVPGFRRRMRNVTILSEDGFGLLERIEDKLGTVIYLDPPYVAKGASYVHDFAPDDHRRLADLVRRFRLTRVVVSYYDHPLVRELYDGWTLRPLKATKSMVNQGRRDVGGAVSAPEVLLINGPSFVATADPSGLFGIN